MNRLRCRLGCGLGCAQEAKYQVGAAIPQGNGKFWRGDISPAHCAVQRISGVSFHKVSEQFLNGTTAHYRLFSAIELEVISCSLCKQERCGF